MHLKGQMLIACGLFLFLPLLHSSRAVSRCKDQACSPPMGNLASGRTITTLSSGGPKDPHPPAHMVTDNAEDPHPPAHMSDDPFLHPDTWWEEPGGGGEGVEDGVEIRLDLETRFCLSHVVVLFRSPRPAAMAVERSADFGRTWHTLKLFAADCGSEFGVPDDVGRRGALCTSRYSGAAPCSGGEVILRTLPPSGDRAVDPYDPDTLARLTLTNLRVRLLKAQSCPPSAVAPAPSSPSSEEGNPLPSAALPPKPTTTPAASPPSSGAVKAAAYAIYTLLARGTCLCHGHAEHCVARNDGSLDTPHDSNVVPPGGRCVCAHHTAGDHCERCAPLHNDAPWRPANGSSGEPNPCRRCECHGHADSCHFSRRAWRSSGGVSGGVCDDCRHNTAGRRCQRCRRGYHRHPSRPFDSPHACTRCWCDPLGSLSVPGEEEEEGAPWCHPRSGQCHCKPGFGGTSCSHCLPGYWGALGGGGRGCRPCDPTTGQCLHSYSNNQVFNVPIGGKVPDLDHMFSHEGEVTWPNKELAVSALHHTGKCSCKERKLRSVSDLCKTKHDYVIKASVLSAHDKGSHAEVQVKVRKVLRSSGHVTKLSPGTVSIYPMSWTSRGCTCPILNPGMEYLLAGPEEAATGRLLVTMQSVVLPWTPRLDAHIAAQALRLGCPDWTHT